MGSGEKTNRCRLPREVWVASISQNDMREDNHKAMIRAMLARMEEVVPLKPDIVCLPEVFAFSNLSGGRPPLAEIAEKPIGPICRPFSDFAREHGCYVICPTYTRQEGRYYNAAVLLDRAGKVVGEYHKLHPTIGEMKKGISPGTFDVPVFRTDFGVIGMQICFDAEWQDGWRKLGEAGAEIVFWPSAYAGGTVVNSKAWEN